MNIKRVTYTVVSALAITLAFSACSSTPGPSPTGTRMENSDTVDGLSYRASGTVGDGPDDALISIKSTTSDPTETVDSPTILPWTRTSVGNDGDKVSMTVESLSSDGTVQCQIFYKNLIIINEASGDHVTVTCEGELSAF